MAALWLVAPTTSLAAGDANSAACPNESSPGFREYLPDCRAYEMVTPVYKGGSAVLLLFNAISTDGSHLIGTSYGGFGGIENNEQGKPSAGAGVYELSRSPTGWQAEPLEPAAYQASSYVVASADANTTLWELAEEASPGVELFTAGERQKLALRVHEPGSVPRFEPIGPEDSPTETVNINNFHFAGASNDLSHILYTIEARNSATWPGDETKGGRSLYEYIGLNSAEPMLVGVKNEGRLKGGHYLNEGAQLVSKCGTELGAYRPGSKYNAVSGDGRTAFFTANACAGEPAVRELYARIDEERTVAISEPARPISPEQGPGPGLRECDAVCQAATPQEGVFQGASADGTTVFFTTAQALLNEDENGEGTGNDLYEAELREGRLVRLVQVSHDPHAGEQAGVQGVARIAATGRRVYFVASGALSGANGRGEAPVAGEHNLYVYDTAAQRLMFVATLAGGDEADWQAEDAQRPFEVTPDGRFAVFVSASHLTADDSSGVAQLFEYDASTEGIARVSIGQRLAGGYLCAATKRLEVGYNCNGNTSDPAQVPVIRTPDFSANDHPTEAASALSLTEDGRVFFMSRDALAPLALEGSKNIYEYSGEDVYLVALGEDPQLEYGAFQESSLEHDRLVSVDTSGTDVFFGAVGQLVPQDTDTQADVYDARVGGGFPAPPRSEVCEGQACRPAAGSGGVALVSPPSAALPGEETPRLAASPAPARSKQATRAQRLAAALRACRRKHGRARRRRCEAAARRRYGGRRAR